MKKLVLLYILFLNFAFSQKIITRINSGGPTVQYQNTTWISDKFFISGGTYSTITSNDVNPIYKDVRHGQFEYNIPVPNGKYKVVLHFAEVFPDYPNRLFHVTINDTVVLKSFNVWREAGDLTNVPVVKSFNVSTTNLSGINLKFVPGTKSAILDGIEIYSDEVDPVVWCPGPVLSRMDDKTFVVGSNWTKDKPCHVNFNIQDKVDPISVQTFDSPMTVSITDEFTGNDQIYVWVSQPNPLINSGKSVITITTKNPNIMICNGNTTCSTTTQTSIPRMFPANTSPVGTFDVFSGRLAVKPNNIMDGMRQITVGPSAGMTVALTDGVMFLQVDPAIHAKLQIEQNGAMQRELIELQVARSKTNLETARIEHLSKLTQASAPTFENLLALNSQLSKILEEFSIIQNSLPINTKELEDIRLEFKNLQNLIAETNKSQHMMYERRSLDAENIYNQVLQSINNKFMDDNFIQILFDKLSTIRKPNEQKASN